MPCERRIEMMITAGLAANVPLNIAVKICEYECYFQKGGADMAWKWHIPTFNPT